MYSQYEEEPAILAAVEHIEHGCVLDLGAFHPTIFSNSRALIEKGWCAVLVEASPEPFLTLLKEYGSKQIFGPNEQHGFQWVTLLNAAVGVKRELATMWATADAVSTTDAKVREVWKEAGGYYGRFVTPVIPLSDISGEFDFVNIDVEGGSVDLLSAVMDRYYPACICVEHDGRQDEVRRMIEGRYEITYQNGTNFVLRRLA